MRATLTHRRRVGLAVLALALAVAAQAAAQGVQPLRKTDLVRLLGARTLSSADLARLVQRNCLSFIPSDRDRRDFVALGADAAVLASVDACVRRRNRGTPTPPAEPTPRATTVPPATRPADSARAPGRAPGDSVAPPGSATLQIVELLPTRSALVGAVGTELSVVVSARVRGRARRDLGIVLRGSGVVVGEPGADLTARTTGAGTATFRLAVRARAGVYPLVAEVVSDGSFLGRTTIPVGVTAGAPAAAEVRPAQLVRDAVGGYRVTVMVRDAGGNPVSGVPVTLRARPGDSIPTVTAVPTDAFGIALLVMDDVPALRTPSLGVFAGGREVAALPLVERAGAEPPVRAARAALPSRLVLFGGGGQRAVAGSALAEPVSVMVTTATGAPASEAWVRFTAAGATVAADSVATDSDGVATVAVRAGRRAGPASITARAGPAVFEVPLVVVPGPPVVMALESGGRPITGIADSATGVTRLVISARDSLGNRTPVSALRFASTSERVARVGSVELGADSATVSLELRGAGSTDVRFTMDRVEQVLPVQLTLAESRRAVGIRANVTLFDYHSALRPKVHGHPGPAFEMFATQALRQGVVLGAGAAFGALQADTVPSPWVSTVQVQVFLFADYRPRPRSRFAPVLTVTAGGYRLRSDAKGAMVAHTGLFVGAGLGVDVALGPALTGEFRVARHTALGSGGSVATLIPIGIGLRFRR